MATLFCDYLPELFLFFVHNVHSDVATDDVSEENIILR